jgi:lambda family phage tail tape measure protein
MADIKYQVQVDAKNGIESLKNLQNQVQETGRSFDGLKKFVVAAGAALGAGAFASSIKNAMDTVDGLAKSARALGTTTANFQAMARSAQLAGVDIATLQATAQRLQVNLINAVEKGTGPAAEGLQRLGLSARELAGQGIDKQFQTITEALSKVENPAERTALSVELLGKQGPRMLEVAENMARMREEVERVGLALSDIDSMAIEQAGDAATELGFLFESVGQKIAAELAPYITAIVQGIKESVLESGNLGEVIRETVIPAIKVTTQAVAVLLTFLAAAKLTAGIVAATTALLNMYRAIKTATTAAAALNAVLGKNPLIRIAGAIAGLVGAAVVVDQIDDYFKDIDASVADIMAGLEKKNEELESARENVGEISAGLVKQKSLVNDIVQAYQQSNADFLKRFDLQTQLINKTQDQRLEIETLSQIEQNYLKTVTDLLKKYQEANSEGKAEIQQALQGISKEYETQIGQARVLIGQRLQELNIQKEQVRLQKELEEATKRREYAEDAVRSVMLDGMDNVRRAMERAELDGLGGITRALREIEIEERRVADAAKRRVAEQFGDNDPQGLLSAMDEIDRASQNIILRRQEVMSSVYEQQRSFSEGWNKAFREYADNATNAARQAQNIFQKTTKGMENAIVNFAKTGKFEFKGFINSILEELLRSQVQQLIAQIFGGRTGGGGGSRSVIGSLLGFANGGIIPTNNPVLVGERGPELLTGAAGNRVIPNNQLGGTVVYNINAVDARSFKELVAQDPSFIYAVTEQGRRSLPSGRR